MRRRRFVAASVAAMLAALFGDAGAAPGSRKAAGKPKAAAKKPAKPAARSPAAPRPQSVDEVAVAPEPVISWRRYDLTMDLTSALGNAPVRLWLPLPLATETAWQKSVEHQWTGNPDRTGTYTDANGDLNVLYAEWQGTGKTPQMRLTSSIATRDRQFDITRRNDIPERPEVLRHYLRSTPGLPTDGLVHATAERIIGRIKDPLARGKAIYDWVADRTRFDTAAAGTGHADLARLVERPETPGRCADINGLFVALARSIGLPARLTFGLRVDQSAIVTSLGQRGELATAQHCRAEFYADGYGWIPVDPADVRKALAEDSSTLDGMKGTVLRKLLFGYWEPNWVAFNRLQEISLRYADGPPLASFAAPYAEIAGQPATGDLRITLTAKRRQDVD